MDPGFPVRHKAHTRYTRCIFETSLATLELLKLNTQLCRVLLVFLFFFFFSHPIPQKHRIREIDMQTKLQNFTEQIYNHPIGSGAEYRPIINDKFFACRKIIRQM